MIKALNSDICCITETHLENNKSIHIDTYTSVNNNRTKKHFNASITHGGTCMLIKNSLLQEYTLTIMEKDIDRLVILRLEHKISKYCVIVCGCYIGPENSIWNNRDQVFEAITSELYSVEYDAVF